MFNRLGYCGLLLWTLGATPHLQAQSPDLVPAADEAVKERYVFVLHEFSTKGQDLEVLIKLDCFTGKGWRFSGADMKWLPILERDGDVVEPAIARRYGLHGHTYQVNGQPSELMLRVDGVSGTMWVYNGNYDAWKKIGLTDGDGPADKQ